MKESKSSSMCIFEIFSQRNKNEYLVTEKIHISQIMNTSQTSQGK